jgi:hypothetical protein
MLDVVQTRQERNVKEIVWGHGQKVGTREGNYSRKPRNPEVPKNKSCHSKVERINNSVRSKSRVLKFASVKSQKLWNTLRSNELLRVSLA